MARQSKQRDAIYTQLLNREDHPTAETLYAELKPELPNLSIATVYRNLKQLEDWGKVRCISTESAARYDFRVAPHSHFFCRECGAVSDIELECDYSQLVDDEKFGGKLESCVCNFYGICSNCREKQI